jgi:hypothetical protein
LSEKRAKKLLARAIRRGLAEQAEIALALVLLEHENLQEQLDAAAASWSEFHWGLEPDEEIAAELADVPPVMWVLGPLVSVTYEARKGPRSRQEWWQHHFDDRPMLTSGNGALWIVGGTYKITERGIEG